MYLLYRIGRFIALIIPRKWGYFLASILADLKYSFSLKDKCIIMDNLRVIFPHRDKRLLKRITRNVFKNFAKYLVDFFRSEKIDKDFIEKNVDFVNIHYLKEALSQKRGVIALTSHLGNWELGGQVSCLMGYEVIGVALPHRNKKIDAFFNYQRFIKGLKVIPLRTGTRKIVETLRERRILALLGDRDFSGSGIKVKFFGKEAILPRGPAILALKTSSVILPSFFVRTEHDGFQMIYDKPIYPEGKDFKDLMKEISGVMEKYILKFVDQWYMFDRLWSN